MTEGVVSIVDLCRVRQGIARQQDLVDSLSPGDERHRIAVDLLLAYRDSLFILMELRSLIAGPEDGAKERW